MPTLDAVRASLIEMSRRHSRVADEVEDLAHDLIVSALRRGLALDGETFLQSAHGAARRHAAFLARSALRRRAREGRSAMDDRAMDGGAEHEGTLDANALGDDDEGARAPVAALSLALRTTLFLLVLGLEKPELRLALGLSDEALRKRFQALRDHGPLARPPFPLPPRTLARAQLRRTQVAMLPRLAVGLRAGASGRVLGTSDPDGHGIIFAELLTPKVGAATSPASRVTLAKGIPCSVARSRTSPSSSSSPTSPAPGVSMPKPSA